MYRLYDLIHNFTFPVIFPTPCSFINTCMTPYMDELAKECAVGSFGSIYHVEKDGSIQAKGVGTMCTLAVASCLSHTFVFIKAYLPVLLIYQGTFQVTYARNELRPTILIDEQITKTF